MAKRKASSQARRRRGGREPGGMVPGNRVIVTMVPLPGGGFSITVTNPAGTFGN